MVSVESFLHKIASRIFLLLTEAWRYDEALWMVLPFIIILVLIHLYFGRNRSEELGWNTAFGNAISLFWVCVLLIRSLVQQYPSMEVMTRQLMTDSVLLKKVMLVGGLSSWVFLLMIVTYFHALPRWLAFTVSSAKPIYITSYLLIPIVIADVPLDLWTIGAGVITYLLLSMILNTLYVAVPMSENAERAMRRREKRETRKKAGKKAARTRRLNRLKDWIQTKIFTMKKYLK